MVKDKVNYRAQGPKTQLTRQPVSGRANDGGLRIGEMERDSIISHGASEFLKESMLVRGDEYYMAVCNKTGAVAIYNPEKNLMMSPMADGPIKFIDSLDGKDMNVEHITKYGRSFSVVRVPYVFKLFMQELQAINVKMAIITEDNVDQFDNLNFTNNISLLTHKSFEDTVSNINAIVDKFNNVTPIRFYSEPSLSLEKESPPYVQESPPYAQESHPYVPDSPPYAQESHPYVPDSPPYAQESHPYVPDSPPYAQESPPYAQESPPYAPESPVQLQKGDYVTLKGDPHIWKIFGIDANQALLNRRDEAQNKRIEIIANLAHIAKAEVQGGALYDVNDVVTFRGDYDKNRKWVVESIEKGFAVIKTDDTAGLTGGTNNKVVALSDIDHYVPPDTLTTLNAPAPSQPPIILNIVNGDGNKVQQASEPKNNTSEPKEPKDNTSNKEEDIFDKPMIKKPSENSSNVFSQGPLVVKKV